jgi:hypothetical protein
MALAVSWRASCVMGCAQRTALSISAVRGTEL